MSSLDRATQGFVPPLALCIATQGFICPRPGDGFRGGHALTEAERRRWGFLDFETPYARRKRRKLCERLKREAFGILEPEECEELVDAKLSANQEPTIRASAAPAPTRESVPKADRARVYAAVLAQVEREVRDAIRERQIMDDDEEIIQLAPFIFH